LSGSEDRIGFSDFSPRYNFQESFSEANPAIRCSLFADKQIFYVALWLLRSPHAAKKIWLSATQGCRCYQGYKPS
jgi:hypothetical protein